MPSRRLSASSTYSSATATTTTTRPASTILIPAISSAAAITLLLLLLFCLLYHHLRRARTLPIPISPDHPHRFSYKDLLAATNSFSPQNAIGQGATATVFRGVLPSGKSVAVKLIDPTNSDAELEFQNELHILSGLKSPYVVTLLGYCVRKSHRILVYEYMPNRSLQESLFHENSNSSSDLSWENRFRIIQDVARALAYLHLECDPPVIHGDVKPSNVLLDIDWRARVSDFGLSRFKIEADDEEAEIEGCHGDDEFGADFSQELSGNVVADSGYNEVDFSQALQASAASKNDYMLKDFIVGERNDIDDEMCVKAEASPDGQHAGEKDRQWGRDWWWRQDGTEELCSKDYVTEWIGSQICPTVNNDWDDASGRRPTSHRFGTSPVLSNGMERQIPAKKETKNWITGCDKKKHMKLHEWWKEEHRSETSKTSMRLKKLEKRWSKSFKKPILALSKSVKLRRKRKFGEHDGRNGGLEGDFSFGRGRKRNKDAQSGGSEMWSGDLCSRELSSTTSMRGTLCYVAPECGGCGSYLMEKADIYSLGVLMLVIVSGRRPLHVLSSPMKLEKANLVSWCRQLAQTGNVLELVDKRLKQCGYVKDQATLCINLALSCLQKMPELRPDIGDVVKILDGEMEMPPLPFELSPSPPAKLSSRSRRRQKVNG